MEGETSGYCSLMKVVPWPQWRVLPDRISALSCFEARWGLGGEHWPTRGVKRLPHVVKVLAGTGKAPRAGIRRGMTWPRRLSYVD